MRLALTAVPSLDRSDRKMDTDNTNFHWPLWALPLAIILSIILQPGILDKLGEARTRIAALSYVALSIRYLWAWRKTGSKVDWIIYMALIILTPLIASMIVAALAAYLC